jgi:hypothetical protein
VLDKDSLRTLQYSLELVTELEEWAKDVRKNAKMAMNGGASFLGWKLVNGGRDTKYKDVLAVAEIITELGYPVKHIEELLPSPAKVRTYLPQAYRILADLKLLEETSREMKLVQDKEPGNAISPSVLALSNFAKLN